MELEIEKFEFGTVPDFSLKERLDILKSFLEENVCKVEFVKLDGTNRDFICTLKKDIVPPPNTPGLKAVKRPNPEENGVLGVYLPKDNTWRSFRINNVISIEIHNPE
jgi:hypothetical protein